VYHYNGRKEPDTMRQTNWYIITGAPSSGKTSVINEIERRGIRVVHEVARAYIDRQLGQGLRLEQIKSDMLQFERHILHTKIKIEDALPEGEPVFFDRGVPDSIAYFILEGLDPAEPFRYSRRNHYRRIFFFERFDFLKDKVRSEDEMTAGRLNNLLLEAYGKIGYDVVMVPVMPVEERVDLVLENIN
jgi:predicted ATPase